MTIPSVDENDVRIINNKDIKDDRYDNFEVNDFNMENILEDDTLEVKSDKLYEESMLSDDSYADSLSLPVMTLKIAKKEADLLIKDAKSNAVQIEKDAFDKGLEEGFLAGEQKYKQELEQKMMELEEKERQLDIEFQNKIYSYEHKIASIIERLVVQLVGSRDDENIILFLVRLALAENTSKGSGKVVINVCEDDYEKVRSYFSEDEFTDDGLLVEVKKNERLSKNDCLLETGFGVIDSSLSVRVDSFIKQMRAIKDSLRVIEDE